MLIDERELRRVRELVQELDEALPRLDAVVFGTHEGVLEGTRGGLILLAVEQIKAVLDAPAEQIVQPEVDYLLEEPDDADGWRFRITDYPTLPPLPTWQERLKDGARAVGCLVLAVFALYGMVMMLDEVIKMYLSYAT